MSHPKAKIDVEQAQKQWEEVEEKCRCRYFCDQNRLGIGQETTGVLLRNFSDRDASHKNDLDCTLGVKFRLTWENHDL